HVVKVIGDGVALQAEWRDEVPQTQIDEAKDVTEGEVEVVQANAADLDELAVDVGRVLDGGEVDLADEVDLFPGSAVGAQSSAAHVRAVLEARTGRGTDEEIVVLGEPGVVPLQPAADVEVERFVLSVPAEAVGEQPGQVELLADLIPR